MEKTVEVLKCMNERSALYGQAFRVVIAKETASAWLARPFQWILDKTKREPLSFSKTSWRRIAGEDSGGIRFPDGAN